ncbi:uncharacterized protein LOC143037397 [Oratosquilla oratoria]|uniref:uncharacterized protein LOC143037397 n=1 Tax=Oratosquilla oratoria TaxID=337810 RepID=UPI003F76A9ED
MFRYDEELVLDLILRGTLIGQGRTCVVYKSSIPEGPDCVVKFYTSSGAHESVKYEAEDLWRIQDVPGIPRLFGLCTKPPSLVISYHGDFNFRRTIRGPFGGLPFNEQDIITIVMHITGILLDLQERNLSHNDLKHDNVMIHMVRKRVLEVTLIDFGALREIGSEVYTKTENPRRHRQIAPELLQGQRITEVSDVYSLGHLLQ